MALTYGFFNALRNANGSFDRTYNAEDYSDNLGAVISSGVLRDNNNGFRVYAADGNDGLKLGVSAGRAWIEGHWAKLDTNWLLPTITPPVGDLPRIDAVLLRLDRQEHVRSIRLQYMQGTPSENPQAPTPTRNANIYDLVLAHVHVEPAATSVTIEDMRAARPLCGWVTSPIGYDDYFAKLDNAFEEWFAEKRNTLAVNTLYKEYVWRTVLTTERPYVDFNIPQYTNDTVSIITVYVNGLRQTEGVDYTLSGRRITFSTAGGGTGLKTAGTEIVVVCNKSVDGTGIGTVADEITELQNKFNSITAANESFYYCNGVNDNVIISQMAQDFLNESTEAGEKTITIVGNFGATAPAAGDGTAGGEPYAWFNISKSGIQNRRVTLDFSGCSVVNIKTNDDKAHCLFTGRQYTVKNLCANFDGANAYLYGQNVYFGSKNVYFENCRIKAVGLEGWLFNFGTFRDCEFSIKTSAYYNGVFRPINYTDVLRVYGGEHFAYTSDESATSAVFHCDSNASNSVIIADGINCPTVAESGYKQTHAVFDAATSNSHRYSNLISELSIHAPSQTVRDTIVASK